MDRELAIRKSELLKYMEEVTGIKLRGMDIKIARGQISHIWKLGFDDEFIRKCIDYLVEGFGASVTFAQVYRSIERFEAREAYKHTKEKK